LHLRCGHNLDHDSPFNVRRASGPRTFESYLCTLVHSYAFGPVHREP
jgi:hypothetical protein